MTSEYHTTVCGSKSPTSSSLSERHWQTLVEGSAIAPDVVEESGAKTIERGSELPGVFSDRQRRRAPGILFVAHRPNGETSWVFRPDRPNPKRPGHKYEQACKVRGGAGNVLDILPCQRDLIDETDVPVIFCEGQKKMMSVVSAAGEAGEHVLVVSITGCWNFLHNGGEPIGDLLDIPLEGRRVTVMYDSDMLRKAEVQDAARRLAEYLQERGARTYVTYFADAEDGSKVGADDFFARGGSFAELRLLTRRYDPQDFVRVRLSRDEQLLAAIKDLERRFWDEEWTGQSEHSARDVYLALIEAAAERGRVVEGGVEIMISWGTLQLRAALGSEHTVGKALSRLESEGRIVRRVAAKNNRKSGGFVLAANARAGVQHYRTEQGTTTESNTDVTSLYAGTAPLRGPRMRWSSPGSKGRRGTTRGTRKVRQSPPPKPRPAVSRPGKVRGHVTDALEHAGGSMSLSALAEELGVSRVRDLTRRRRTEKGRDGLLVWHLEAGIVTVDGDTVSLSAEWLERVEGVREAGGEIEAEELAKRHYEIKRRAFHSRKKRQKSRTSTGGLAAVRESRNRRRAYLDEHAGDTAKETPSDDELVAMRRRVQQLVREGMTRRFAEEEVYGSAASSARSCSDPPSGSAGEPGARKMPRMIEGVYVHGAVCECEWCAA